jgi:hypothetical protein
VITIIGDFDQISAKTIAVFLKTNVMINSGCMYFESKISYCFSNISIIILNTVPCSQFGTGAQRETISFFYTCIFHYRICPQNLTDSVCDDLTNDANQDYQNEIQVKKRTRCVHLHVYTQIGFRLFDVVPHAVQCHGAESQHAECKHAERHSAESQHVNAAQ